MVSILIVGDVPSSIVVALEVPGNHVQRVALADRIPKGGHDALALHVPEQWGRDEAEQIDSWLLHRYWREAPVALTVPRATLEFLSRFYLKHPGISPVVETHHLTADGAASGAAMLLARLGDVAEPDDSRDDLAFGRYFRIPDGRSDYRKQRSMSLVAPSMQVFLEDLRDAVIAMGRPVGSSDGLCMPDLPWFSNDGGVTTRIPTENGNEWKLSRQTSKPNLTDLFYAHNDESARSILRSDGSQTSRQEIEAFDKPPNLLILGDSGTGKTMVARLVYDLLAQQSNSQRTTADPVMPFVEINCGGMTVTNIDHDLHGAAPGLYTDVAVSVGLLARAAYGVAFFDELGDLDYEAQKRLLTYLESGLVSPKGMQAFPGFTRVIGATNRDLGSMIRRHEFRHDLRARFGKKVTIPSLSERGEEEIRRLVDFVALNPMINPKTSGDLPTVSHLTQSAMKKLTAHDYADGNFRELEGVVHAAIERARRRRSKLVDHCDVIFGDQDFVRDAERAVVDLAPGAKVPGTPISLGRREDIERLAGISGRPLLRDADGALWLSEQHIAYVWSGGATEVGG